MKKEFTCDFSTKIYYSIEEAYQGVLENYCEYDSLPAINEIWEKFSESKRKLFKNRVFLYFECCNTNITYQWTFHTLCEILHMKKADIAEALKETEKELYELGYGDQSISKEEEIAIIKNLCLKDSYFAEAFGKHFEQMKSNILNDFPIMTNIEL